MAASILNGTNISEKSKVTASSFSTTGVCSAPVLCNPNQVIVDQIIGTRDRTEWVSAEEITSIGKCSPQWLEFAFTSSDTITLQEAQVQYGDLSNDFDGGKKICPQVFVSKNMDDTITSVPVEASKDYACASRQLTLPDNSTTRVDRILFDPSIRVSGVKRLRLVWDSLQPRGSLQNKLCQMGVELVLIESVKTALPPVQQSSSSVADMTGSATQTGSATLGNGGNVPSIKPNPNNVEPSITGVRGSGTTSSDSSAVGLSGAAVSGIVLLVLAAALVVTVLVMRHYNINRKRMAAISLRTRRVIYAELDDPDPSVVRG